VVSDSATSSSRAARVADPLREPKVLGVAVALVGVVGALSALTPAIPRRIGVVESFVDPGAVHLAAGTTVLLAFVLMLVGRGVARRRHAAYVMAVVALGLLAVTHIVKGLDVEEALLTTAVAVCLVRARREFTVPSPAGRWREVARVAAILVFADVMIAVLAYGVGDAAQLKLSLAPGRVLVQVIELLGGAGGMAEFHGVAQIVPVTVALLGFATVAIVMVVAFAPMPQDDAGGSRRRVAALTNRPDGDTLDPFALRSDKQYVFSGDERAAVAYRYVGGVGLASGDPVGAPDAFPDAIRRFIDHCDASGWRPGFMGVRGDRLHLYADADLRSHYLGDEAVLGVRGFTLDTPAMRGVRQACNRTRNFGITTEILWEHELPPELRDELLVVAEAGRDGAPERGFSMALDGLLAGREPDCVIAIARDSDGRAFAFQRYLPCRAGACLSLDTMRRERVGPNGVNERLIVDVAQWASERGIDEVSLNFAFCKALIDDENDLTVSQQMQAWLVRRISPHFQIDSLLQFNAKFGPRWVPRYIVYRSLGDFAPVGVAAATAEGFLSFGRSPAG
jgi:lysyl-tRNA synthetase class 2